MPSRVLKVITIYLKLFGEAVLPTLGYSMRFECWKGKCVWKGRGLGKIKSCNCLQRPGARCLLLCSNHAQSLNIQDFQADCCSCILTSSPIFAFVKILNSAKGQHTMIHHDGLSVLSGRHSKIAKTKWICSKKKANAHLKGTRRIYIKAFLHRNNYNSLRTIVQ